jgi:anti-anti-sigma factor
MDPLSHPGDDSVMPRQVPSLPECPRIAQPGAADAWFTVSAATGGVGIGRVRVTGRLTEAPAAERLAAVLRDERANGCHVVRLDLSELSMLDRVGLDVVVDAHRRLLEASGALVLTGVPPRIARLLQLIGLDRTLFVSARSDDVPTAAALPPSTDLTGRTA